MEEPTVKTCNTCKKKLQIRFFHKQGNGYRGKCSICYSTYRKDKGWEKARYEKKKTAITGTLLS